MIQRCPDAVGHDASKTLNNFKSQFSTQILSSASFFRLLVTNQSDNFSTNVILSSTNEGVVLNERCTPSSIQASVHGVENLISVNREIRNFIYKNQFSYRDFLMKSAQNHNYLRSLFDQIEGNSIAKSFMKGGLEGRAGRTNVLLHPQESQGAILISICHYLFSQQISETFTERQKRIYIFTRNIY